MENQVREQSLKDLFEQIKEFVFYLWKKKFWLIAVSIIFGLLGFLYAYRSTPVYSATITYMVNDDGKGSDRGVAAIVGMLGFPGRTGKVNLDKVVALSTSQKIIKKSILDTVYVNGERMLLGNYIVNKLGLIEQWKEKEDVISEFKGFRNNDSLTIPENAAFKQLYSIIAGEKNKNRYLSSAFDEDNTILNLNITTDYDTLSYLLVKSIFKNLQDFYIFQSIEQPLVTVQELEKRVASIEGQIKKSDVSLAVKTDRAEGLWKTEDAVPQQQISRDIKVNTIVYGELLKNLEAARFTLQTTTPVFQIIDEPLYPIKESTKSIKIFTLLGFIIGGGLMIGIYYILYTIKNES